MSRREKIPTVLRYVATRFHDLLFPRTLGRICVCCMGDGVNRHLMALEIELLRVLILIVVRLGEKGHLGSAVEVVSSLIRRGEKRLQWRCEPLSSYTRTSWVSAHRPTTGQRTEASQRHP